MSVHFEKIIVKEIRKETADCVSLVFDIPPIHKEAFRFKQGQHLTLRTFINGEELRRSYSLCSSPLENEWRVAVKKQEAGIFSSYANQELKAGDTIELIPPLGHFFTEINIAHKKNYIAFAAGSGITPVLSLIKTILAAEPYSSFTLVYGNRNRSSIIFREALEALKNRYMERFSIIHILSREMTDAEINHGRIDAAKCSMLFEKLISPDADEFFICGPEQMIFTVKEYLEKKGAEEKKIHFELFTPSVLKHATANVKHEKEEEGRKCKATIRMDGIFFDVDVDFGGDSILDAALFHGMDLPYSCKGGVCCTCKARLLEGKVEMDAYYGLEEDEVRQGYILTCQSHPKTEKVVIDFDIK